MMVIDAFAGAGGWSEGARAFGLHTIGFELDKWACATRDAAGHATVRTDVASYPAETMRGRVRGLIASPPCATFSTAGQGDGIKDLAALHRAIEACRGGWTEPEHEWYDARTALILEPLRWAWAVAPEWIACEQVPPCLPVWKHMADVLRSWGYDAVALKLSAEQYGVPQTRLRAFLLAHRDGVRTPTPTHQRYRHGEAQGAAEECQPSLLGPGLLPWVSMADALGWDGTLVGNQRPPGMNGEHHAVSCDRPAQSITSNAHLFRLIGNHSIAGEGLAERDGDEPALTVGSRADQWRLRMGNQDGATERPVTEPAATVLFGNSPDDKALWVTERPATTVVGSYGRGRIAPPGHHGTSTYESDDTVRVTLAEASVLQSFRPDYPWRGTKSARFRQCGNACPPLVCRAVLGALTGGAP